MNRFLILLLCSILIFGTKVNSQKTYFVYLQTDNQQPFYVNINGKNISSSSIGYIILSKLVDSTYLVKIGFPGTSVVHDFEIKINGNDQGYLVKDFGEKGWGIFNLQSLAVLMSSTDANKLKAAEALQKAETEKRADSLALVAAQLDALQSADSIKAVTARQEQLQKDSIALAIADENAKVATVSEIKAESPALKETSTNTASLSVIGVPIVVAAAAEKEKVTLDSVLAKRESLKVAAAPVTDTLIKPQMQAVDDTLVTKTETAPVQKNLPDSSDKKVVSTAVAATTGVAVAGTPKFLDMELKTDTSGAVTVNKVEKNDTIIAKPATDSVVTAAADTGAKTKSESGLTSNNSNTKIVAVPVVTIAAAPSSAVSTGGNPACKQTATEKDFFSLRKKMVANDDVSEMILVAKKTFKEKCFSTSQVGNLCVLFLDDPSRYNFLDQVYEYTYDWQNYKQLADLLKDQYYIRRFNALLR